MKGRIPTKIEIVLGRIRDISNQNKLDMIKDLNRPASGSNDFDHVV